MSFFLRNFDNISYSITKKKITAINLHIEWNQPTPIKPKSINHIFVIPRLQNHIFSY